MRAAVSIVMVVVLACLSGCMETEEPYYRMTVLFSDPIIELRDVGNDTLFDADLVVMKCSPKDEGIDRHIVWVTIRGYDGSYLLQNERLTCWTGVEPEGVWVYDIDGSSDGFRLDENDTLRITGLDSRFLGSMIEVGWDRNGREKIGDAMIPLHLIQVEERRSLTGPANNTSTTINMSIEMMLLSSPSMDWDNAKIELGHKKGLSWRWTTLRPEAYSEPMGDGIQAWYVDSGSEEGFVDVGDAIVITGLDDEHANDKASMTFNGEGIKIIAIPTRG